MKVTLERTPIADQSITVVSPCGNGQDPRPILTAVRQQLQNHPHELLLAPYATLTGDFKETGVRVIPEVSGGYGQALATALSEAKTPLVFTWPAAWAECPVDLAKLLAFIDHADVVASYRPGRSWLARCQEGWSTYLWFGLGLADVCCPIRLYRRSILERIPVQSQGRFADVEILAKANFLNGLMTEVELAKSLPAEKDATWSADYRKVLFHPEFAPGPAAPAPAPA